MTVVLTDTQLAMVRAALEHHLRCHADQDGGCDREDHDDAAEALRLLGWEPHLTQDEYYWHAGRVTSCEDERCRRAVRRAEKVVAAVNARLRANG